MVFKDGCEKFVFYSCFCSCWQHKLTTQSIFEIWFYPTPILKKFFQFSACNSFFFSFLYIPQIISYYIGRGKPISTPNEIKHTITIKLSIFYLFQITTLHFLYSKNPKLFTSIPYTSQASNLLSSRHKVPQNKPSLFIIQKIPYYIHHNPSLFFLICPINNFLLYRERKTQYDTK